jgi:hypothetical protein
LSLKYDIRVSKLAFKCNLYCYAARLKKEADARDKVRLYKFSFCCKLGNLQTFPSVERKTC